MVVYSIPMKFRYASGDIDYSNCYNELEDGKKAYNDKADKMKKARKITRLAMRRMVLHERQFFNT